MASAVIVSKAMGDKIARNVKFALGFAILGVVAGAFNFLTPSITNILAIASVSIIAAN